DDGVGGLIAVDASFKSRADRGRGLDDDLIPWTLGAGRHGEIEGDLVGILVGPTADLMYSLHRAVRVDDGLDGFLNLVHRPPQRRGTAPERLAKRPPPGDGARGTPVPRRWKSRRARRRSAAGAGGVPAPGATAWSAARCPRRH